MENAMQITSQEYMNLENPQFVSQTRVNEDGIYKMYFRVGEDLYFTVNRLF
jgi:hypothetical protein